MVPRNSKIVKELPLEDLQLVYWYLVPGTYLSCVCFSVFTCFSAATKYEDVSRYVHWYCCLFLTKNKKSTSAASSTDRQIGRYSTLQAAWTVRVFPIISRAIDKSILWPAGRWFPPLDATRVDETIMLTAGSTSTWCRPVPFRALKQQIDARGSGFTRRSKVGVHQFKRDRHTKALKHVNFWTTTYVRYELLAACFLKKKTRKCESSYVSCEGRSYRGQNKQKKTKWKNEKQNWRVREFYWSNCKNEK